MRDVPLGTLIFRAGLLGEEQLEDALQEGMRTGKRLGEVLLERGWLNERDLGRMLAGQKGLPFVDVAVSDVEPDALQALNEEDARRQIALPLFYEEGRLVIAVGDPSNQLVLEGLRREIGADFQLVVAPHGQLRQVIDEAYARPAPASDPPVEGVLFPELLAQAQPGAPVEDQPEPEPEPVLEFTPAVDLEPEPQAEAAELEAPEEPEPEPEPEHKPQPFSGPTPTLLSRMLFPSVRHAAQEVEADEDPDAEAPAQQPEAEAPAQQPEAEAPAQQPEAEAPAQQPEAAAPAPAEEDFAELEVPTVPEMPVSSFDQRAAEPDPERAQGEAPSEPAAQAEPAPSEPEPEPEAEASKYFVLVRLRDGERLQIGEFGSSDEASALARDAVGQISSAAGEGMWPLFAGRYLSPDTIVSVDLLEESSDA